MKKYIFLLLFLVHFVGIAQSIQMDIDKLKNELLVTNSDTLKVIILLRLGDLYENISADSMLYHKLEALQLSKEIGFRIGSVNSDLGGTYRIVGDFPKAFEYLFEGLKVATEEKDYYLIGLTENRIAIVYAQLQDDHNAIIHQKRALKAYVISGSQESHLLSVNSMASLGRVFRRNMQLDSASLYFQKAFKYNPNHPFLLKEMGELEFLLNNQSKAFEYLKESIRLSEKQNNRFHSAFAHNTFARLFKIINEVDSSIYHAEIGYSVAEEISSKFLMLESCNLLAELYENKDSEKEIYYLKKVIELDTELYGVKKVQELQKTLTEEQTRQRMLAEEQLAYSNKLKQYGFLAGLVFLMLVAFLLYRNNKRKQRANDLLQSQKEEIDNQKQKAESALIDLRSTQRQLIQKEKMASLGELTAGIAHEIQNPLNFVNNFSEVTQELGEELAEEGRKEQGERDFGLEAELIDDIKENLKKINHHGNRASSIVKGMLEHSRTSEGEKVPTDINALAGEYLRLAYHGLRAKDKSFNADFKTDFDENLPKVNVIPQDIGRVLLNLINNSFQACAERPLVSGTEPSLSDKPLVTISTKLTANSQLLITIKDNGPGIPPDIKDKIFQPFFTTKPTGKGTGLGLSLAYDIVKAHGGELKLESVIGEGAEFTISIPIA